MSLLEIVIVLTVSILMCAYVVGGMLHAEWRKYAIAGACLTVFASPILIFLFG